MNISILGCGAFGYALGILLAKTHNQPITITDVDEKIIQGVKKGSHPYFFTDITPPTNLIATSDIQTTVTQADILILAVPAQIVRKALTNIKDHLKPSTILLNTSKALEDNTNKRLSQVIQEITPNPLVILSGGMIAADVANGWPVGAELASIDKTALNKVHELFLPTTVHVEMTSDIAGVEYAGSFKNVIAIGAGIISGLNLGASSKALFIAQSLKELETLSTALGANIETFHTASNAWMGDLMTTCFGNSRNHYFGELLSKEKTTKEALEILEKQHKRAEGYATLHVVNNLLKEHNIKAPFLTLVYQVVYEDLHTNQFLKIAQLQCDKI